MLLLLLAAPWLAPGQEPITPTRRAVAAMPAFSAGSPPTAAWDFLPPAPAFAALEAEYRAQEEAWKLEIVRLAAAGGAGSYPAAPAAAWYPRFRSLADAGDPRARLWCLQQLDLSAIPSAHLAGYWRGEAYGLATVLCTNETGASALRSAALPGKLLVGEDEFDAWLAYLGGIAPGDEVRRATLAMRAALARQSADPAVAARAEACERELVERWPESLEAQRALGRRFAAERLQVGMPTPEATGKDVDGREIRLSAYRGKVVVLDFWGFW